LFRSPHLLKLNRITDAEVSYIDEAKQVKPRTAAWFITEGKRRIPPKPLA